ncbi:succinyl-diaminopimelate desuccinylase [Pseudoalteromonas sp. MMG022]|uniref:succinyl-diaminopimelate desuccinylase n=1 Tax=Pseudoalteromonas sp. MMG022 TaxID=2909978 RepID=UPI001F01D68F|nr:succinyl-diaminopimelate desuccinylase [Pseudoalteromonas sp. MMG022]MCF6436748.1 succinyl-diaminopimelate desuccinylase [Pseudoalteromonas sp. MMG022]
MSSHILDIFPLVVTNTMCKSPVEYAQTLVRLESVTPYDAGCQDWLEQKMNALGADITRFKVGNVSNLIAVIDKGDGPNIAFCGHTDVVPAGDSNKWDFPPFSGHIEQGVLYGRGIADMKGGIAAFIGAAERLVKEQTFTGKLWLFITSDEEGEAEHGSRAIVDRLKEQGVYLDCCIIGEPTANQEVGDVVKIGRRGSISFDVEVQGKAAHAAYPQYGINAVHLMSQVIENLKQHQWDEGCENQPGTNLEVTYINSGDWTDNVIPSKVVISLNVRYSHQHTETEVKNTIERLVSAVTSEYNIKSYRSCVPYFCEDGAKISLTHHVREAIREMFSIDCIFSTSGGTSDGRFFKEVCSQVIEIGLSNKTIHQINERVEVTQIDKLSHLYFSVFSKLFSQAELENKADKPYLVTD